MLYERNLTLEQRYFGRLCGLFNLKPFRGKNLTQNNPLNAKRNDSIPVAQETFDDGSTLTVTLKSDKNHYFFEKILETYDGRKARELDNVDIPLDFTEEEAGKRNYFLALKMYDSKFRNGYAVNVMPVPNNVYTVTVNCKSFDRFAPVTIYCGTRDEAPEMTPEYVGNTLANELLERCSGNMAGIAKFLIDAYFVLKEERCANGDFVLNSARSNNPQYINECVKIAMKSVEEQTGWAHTATWLENNTDGAAPKGLDP